MPTVLSISYQRRQLHSLLNVMRQEDLRYRKGHWRADEGGLQYCEVQWIAASMYTRLRQAEIFRDWQGH